jgi:hypothetical protein
MTLTDRDRRIAMGLVPFIVVVAYWFLLIGPKRQAASAAGETLAGEQQRLADAQGRAGTVAAAEQSFERDYATVLRLGKAIPTSVDMPSLLVQLEQAARGTGIEFEKVTVGDRTPLETSTSSAASAAPAAAPASGTPAAPAPGGAAPQSGPGQAAATAQGAADTASTPPPTADAAAAPASGAAAPSGATPTGDSALEAVPLDFGFNGSFFEMASFFHRLKRFVYVDGDKVRVRGRLMTIDSVQYTAASFPTLTAQVHATVFLTPKAEGATAGATSAGPAPAPAATPPTSTASSGGGAAPAPTATVTP